MTFTETAHPREADGKFAEKLGAAPEVALQGFLLSPPDTKPDIVNGQFVVYEYEDRNGDQQTASGRVLHTGYYEGEDEKIFTLLMDDGDTWSGMRASEVSIDASRDSTKSIEDAKRFDAAYAVVRDLPQDSMDQSDRMHMLDIERGINEGHWEDWRIQADKAFDNFREESVRLDPENGDILRDHLDDAHEGNYRHLSRLGITDDEKRELGITHRTALAVLYRDRIGTSDLWTQEHYDHVTRPYREATGKKAHPDDSNSRPASWNLRQHTSLSPAAKYDGPAWNKGSLTAHADSLWAEARADQTNPLKVRAATIATAALDKLYGQKAV